MKRNPLFMSVLASLFLAGCSQEEIVPNGEDNGTGEANTNYMVVNLMPSDVTGTRAANGWNRRRKQGYQRPFLFLQRGWWCCQR